MWSRRFETPLVLHPPDRSVLAAIALAAWVPATVLVATAPIPMPAALVLGMWLLVSVGREIRTWSRQPARAIWRPRTGWSLEWPDGSRQPARLSHCSRIYPGWLALDWTVMPSRRIRWLLLPTRGRAATLRRLRVLLRYGRADG